MFETLAEHVDVLVGAIGFLINILGYMIWKKLNTIESQLERRHQEHIVCREELPRLYAKADTVHKIFDRLDAILKEVTAIPATYRTKQEAYADWNMMQLLIKEIQESMRKIEARQLEVLEHCKLNGYTIKT